MQSQMRFRDFAGYELHHVMSHACQRSTNELLAAYRFPTTSKAYKTSYKRSHHLSAEHIIQHRLFPNSSTLRVPSKIRIREIHFHLTPSFPNPVFAICNTALYSTQHSAPSFQITTTRRPLLVRWILNPAPRSPL